MYLFGMFPWECVDCQKRFFSSKRYSRSRRHPAGEIYTGTERTPKVKSGSKESHSS